MNKTDLIFVNIPNAIPSYVIASENSTYTIVINICQDREKQLQAYYHEMEYIKWRL